MKKKCSILIFVLFMMIVTSLFAILIAIFLKNILNRWTILYKFEKAYYLAYWGIELELTKIKYHSRWFEDKIDSWSNTNKNWKCKNCYFSVTNKSLSKFVVNDRHILEKSYTSCSDINENWFINFQKAGDGILLPLYINTDSNLNNENPLSGNDINPITNFTPVKLFRTWQAAGVSYIFGITDWNTTKIITWTFSQAQWNIILLNSLPTFTNKKIFWGYFQKTNQNMHYCFQFSQKVPTNWNLVSSEWIYQNFQLILKWTKFSKIPEYIVYSIIK